jgi:hypothetical protein
MQQLSSIHVETIHFKQIVLHKQTHERLAHMYGDVAAMQIPALSVLQVHAPCHAPSTSLHLVVVWRPPPIINLHRYELGLCNF